MLGLKVYTPQSTKQYISKVAKRLSHKIKNQTISTRVLALPLTSVWLLLSLCLIYKMGIVSVTYSSEGKSLPIGDTAALRGNAYLMEALAAEGKISPKQILRLWKERLPLWKCCISPGEGILAVGSPGITQSHIAQQTLQKRFTGREEPRRVAASAWIRSSRTPSRGQTSYRVSWGAEISKVLCHGPWLRLGIKSGAECFFLGFSLISSQGQGPFTLQRYYCCICHG